MTQYRMRHFFAVFALLAIPVLACGVGPVVWDLIQRVEVLEEESALLLQQLDSVQAESDATPGMTVVTRSDS